MGTEKGPHEDTLRIGRIGKAHGIRGELRLFPDDSPYDGVILVMPEPEQVVDPYFVALFCEKDDFGSVEGPIPRYLLLERTFLDEGSGTILFAKAAGGVHLVIDNEIQPTLESFFQVLEERAGQWPNASALSYAQI